MEFKTTNVLIELTQPRAEFFVLCERDKDFLEKCLKYKHKIQRLFEARPLVFEVINSNIIIDSDPSGAFHNIKVIVNNHW